MRFIYAIILLSLLSATCKKSTTQNVPKLQLVWSDEFDYNGLPNTTKWTYDIGGHGWGNNELQYYTNAALSNVTVSNGLLTISANKEQINNNAYSSARLITKGKYEFQYGRVEIRAKLPSGRGSWPALWMLGANTNFSWPKDGEIDIMEHVGHDLGRIHGSVHTQKYNHILGTQKTANKIIADCNQNFHVYTLDWTSNDIILSIDGIPFFTYGNDNTGYDAWPFNNKMYLLLNIAVGGNWGGAQDVDDAIFPAKMEIDYVRVYQ